MKKLFSIVFVFVFALGLAFTGTTVNAQTATFPAGCSSGLGYSVTTGLPCNGTSTATVGPIAGCSTALGFSVINGVPCSGTNVAISYLAGCSSINGYSVITGAPCNGTSMVSGAGTVDPTTGAIVITVPNGSLNTPGLPTTGAGSDTVANVLMLAALAGVAVYGVSLLAKNSEAK